MRGRELLRARPPTEKTGKKKKRERCFPLKLEDKVAELVKERKGGW